MSVTWEQLMGGWFKENGAALVGEEHYRPIGHRTGSTDMGDLSQVMPVLHPYVGGARGNGHGADFEIVDKPLPYLVTAKAPPAIAVDRLPHGPARAPAVLQQA